ncbi:MAG: hypothetical protein JWO28_3004 [Hyphomicrobiales bacterium]|jgi:hypothetical protein|nr:hypothetical protein [Hyphomicrobiales bacterium]
MSDAGQLIGTWKQLSGVVEEVGTGVSRSNLSTAPSGFITFSADGRIVNLTVDSSRKKPQSNPPTAAEAEALFRSLIAYAGTYEVDGNKVTYQLDVSWNELWTGTEQVRYWRIEGDKLHVSTPEIVNPLTGKKSIHRLVFEKVAAVRGG